MSFPFASSLASLLPDAARHLVSALAIGLGLVAVGYILLHALQIAFNRFWELADLPFQPPAAPPTIATATSSSSSAAAASSSTSATRRSMSTHQRHPSPLSHTPHTSAQHLQQQQQLAADQMDGLALLPSTAAASSATGSSAASTPHPPRHPNLAGLNTSSIDHRAASSQHMPANIPSSPVSPMCRASQAQRAKPPANSNPPTAEPTTNPHKDESTAMEWMVDGKATAEDVPMQTEADAHITLAPFQPQLGQFLAASPASNLVHHPPEEQMSRDDEEELQAQAHAHLDWEAEQAMQLHEDAQTYVAGQRHHQTMEDEFEDDEEFPEATTAPPMTPSTAALSREEKLEHEAKLKQRRKFAEMRYLVNNMYRCMSGDTVISTSPGVGVPLEVAVALCPSTPLVVYGASKSCGQLARAPITKGAAMGSKACIKLQLLDGRTLICTPDHRVMAAPVKGRMEQAKFQESGKLEVGALVVCGPEFAADCGGSGDELDYKLLDVCISTDAARLRAHAIMRVLGYLLTDGNMSFNTSRQTEQAQLHMGHELDVASVLADLKLIDPAANEPSSSNLRHSKSEIASSTYSIHLPVPIVKLYVALGVPLGRRIDSPPSWPAFLSDPELPKSLLREFIGGLMGGDGHSPSLTGGILAQPAVFTQLCQPQHSSVMNTKMEQLRGWMARLGVAVKLYDTTETRGGTTRARHQLMLPTARGSLDFATKIGFRHCVHKQARQTASLIVQRIRAIGLQQRNAFIQSCLRRIKNGASQQSALDASIAEHRATAVHESVVKMSCSSLSHYTTGAHDFGEKMPQGFWSDEELVELIGARNCFSDGQKVKRYGVARGAQMPAFLVPLMSVTKVEGEVQVFDVSVPETVSFLANGILVHNCCDCMLPATDMEQGFDEHAPPRRPAARPSAGPGSEYCCAHAACLESLPADFPVDLIPIMHSYLLTDSPSRSFLTTPPLPSQGTLMCYILKTSTKFELFLEMKHQETFVQMRRKKEELEKKKRDREERRGSETGLTKAEEAELNAASVAAAAEIDAEMQDAAAAASATVPVAAAAASSSSSSSSSQLPSTTPGLQTSHSEPLSSPVVRSLDDAEIGLHSTAIGLASASFSSSAFGASLPLSDEEYGETPAEMHSPTHSLDYEKLFPEPLKPLVATGGAQSTDRRRRIIRSASGTPELRGMAGPGMHLTAQLAFERSFAAGPRRMSEPLIFAQMGAARAAAAASSAGASVPGRRMLPPSASSLMSSAVSSKAGTPQSVGRRLSLGASSSSSSPAVVAAVAAALPPSESNLHLHNTRTNAINSMLKHHAETIIAEGKDIFLLCAQRKRSWAGNYYLISSDRDSIKPEGPAFMGKLKSNFGGTDYFLVDNGVHSPSRRRIEKLQSHTYPTYAAHAAASAPKEPTRNAMTQWLTGSSSSPQTPHVRHELACILYDHFYEHCLERNTPVMRADRRTAPAWTIKAGDRLMGMGGLPVVVQSTDHLVARRVYELRTDGGSMTITGEHMLTLCVCRQPTISFHRTSHDHPMREMRVSYFHNQIGEWKQATWRYVPIDETSTDELEQIPVPTLEGEAGAVGVPADINAVLTSLSHDQLQGVARRWLVDHAQDVARVGDLIEVKANKLNRRWKAWSMGTPTPMLAAYRVLEAAALPTDLAASNSTSSGPAIAAKAPSRSDQSRVPIRSLALIEAATEVVNIQIDHPVFAHRRYVLGNGLLTHNSGSPIRIKVLLPNRAFDLVTEAAVSGSILKQHKIECERQEKRKAEADAKQIMEQQQHEESKRKAHAPAPHQSHQHPHPPHANSEAAAGDHGMTDVETTLVEATQSAMAAAASSSPYGNSAAVAPLGEMPPVSAEACGIDTYENLRPVWHDGMNAYVLHFDHHRVREKSVKNFRLVRSVPDPSSTAPGATIQHTVLQFGRVLDRNVFVMDYGYPLSALSAFAICLSSIDPKLAV